MEDEISRDLYSFVGRELHETAWHVNLPINPSIGLHCFLEALRENEFNIKYHKRNKKIDFSVFWEDREYETSLSHEEIIRGWDHSAPSTLRELYNSMYKIHDNIGAQVDQKDLEKHKVWSRFRDSYPRRVRERMEELILPYFEKHHEHMFLPFSYEVPELKEPETFHKAIKEYPLHLHQKVAEWETLSEDGWKCGPCSEYIPEMDEGEFDQDYYPSDSGMTEYFWGIYLREFSKRKGYRLLDGERSDKNSLRSFIVAGEKALESGSTRWDKMKRPYKNAFSLLSVS